MHCLPHWHTALARVPRTRIQSGCGRAGSNGRVPCLPEAMRARAESDLRAGGWWSGSRPLSLAAYTLARHAASEHGSGSVEARMLLALSTIARARMWYDGDPNKLLLYHRPMIAAGTYGSYGPIHGPEGVSTAPYGRWASTSLDPTAQDVLIADYALSGRADSFRHGADDQIGLKYLSDRAGYVRRKAASGTYWVGHVPGVNPMETFFVTSTNIAANSPAGRRLTRRALDLLDDPRTQAWLRDERVADVPWASPTRVCSAPSAWLWTLALTGVAGVAGAAYLEGASRRTARSRR